MAIHVRCDCGALFQVREEYAGKKGQCPTCGNLVMIPAPGEAGEFGVLESHERFLTPLQLGPMEIIRDSGNEWAAITSGLAIQPWMS